MNNDKEIKAPKCPYLSKYKKSVIIGLYRNGCPIERIAVETGIGYDRVEKVIGGYFKGQFQKPNQ